MARLTRWRRPRGRRALLLVLIPLALLVAVAFAVNPIVEARVKHRIEARLGEVRSVEIDRSPLAWLTGAPVKAKVALGDATIKGGQPLLGAGAKLSELDLTADSLTLPRVRLTGVHLHRKGNAITARAVVSEQEITLAGRSMTVKPEAQAGTLVLKTSGVPFVPELRVAPSDAGVVATVVGGPLDGRSVPLGKGGANARAGRLDQLEATNTAGGVAVTAQLTREDA